MGIKYKDLVYPKIKKGMYKVSEYGDIINIITNHKLKTNKNNQGYKVLSLQCEDNTGLTVSVHRIVAYTFLGNPNKNKNVVNHLDGNKENNHYSNLEWTDHIGNNKHAVDMGLNNIYSSKNKFKKYTDELTHDICKLFEKGLSVQDVLVKYDKKDDSKFYRYLINIRMRHERTDISKYYKFDTTTGWKKWYHYEKDKIIELLKSGYKSVEIYRLYGYTNIKEYEQFYSYIKDLKRSLKNKKVKSSTTNESVYLDGYYNIIINIPE